MQNLQNQKKLKCDKMKIIHSKLNTKEYKIRYKAHLKACKKYKNHIDFIKTITPNWEPIFLFKNYEDTTSNAHQSAI